MARAAAPVLVVLGVLSLLPGRLAPPIYGDSSGAAGPPAEPAGTAAIRSAGAGSEAESGGERQIRALAWAYPDRVAEFGWRDGDWALRIDGTWYHWASGRLLPDRLRDRSAEYASYRFYFYPLELPPLPHLEEESARRLQARLDRSEADPPRRYGGFLDDLYEARTRGETERQIVTVTLAGFPVRVHRRIAGPLRAVDRRLQALAATDPQVARFLAGLRGVAGYNWRAIAGTRSRSYHSYGIAVDLEPRSFGGKYSYWRWAASRVKQWYAIPYERRWMVPPPVVTAFEEEGFVWGGKWFFFDTMHFEYRPEILILARAPGEQ